MASPSVAATTRAQAPSASTPATSPNGPDGFPQWLQPGVSPGIHLGLRVVLLMLNGLLGWCALLQVLSPHFEFMFLLSLGLTASYFWFMWELGKIQTQGASTGVGRDGETVQKREEGAAAAAAAAQGDVGNVKKEQEVAKKDM